MATGTVTHALRKLYKAIVGQDIAKNNPTKIINDLADNWPEGITIESLSVTENDTYTAPEGKAYSPVTVNVSGGSSDFSTAQVTFNLTPPTGGEAVSDIHVYSTFGFNGGTYQVVNSWAAIDNKTSIVLHNGEALISGITTNESLYYADISQATVSGNASLTDDGIAVTGDCTITGTLIED